MQNSMAFKHPELISEWSTKNYPITINDVSYGSKKIYWWTGKCGHEWTASPKSRSCGEQCPICSGARVVEGINDLKSQRPDLMTEWSDKNSFSPTSVSVGSHKKAVWIGKCGHEWTAVIKNRTLNNTGCPYCSHNIVLQGFNDLESVCPGVASEWSHKNYPLKPNMVTPFCNRKVWWVCNIGHEWQSLISTRSYGSKCPYCSGIKLLKGFNDLQTKYPSLAEEWSDKNYPLIAEMVNEKSRKNVWWICRECGNEWKAVVNSRVNGLKCPVCAERKVLKGYNDIATTDSELMKEWAYDMNTTVKPSSVSRYSHKSIWWKCHYGHFWKDKIVNRTVNNMSCKECNYEFSRVFPQLLIGLYSQKTGVAVKLNSDKILGLPLLSYFPEDRFAIEVFFDEKERLSKISFLRRYLCMKNKIELIEIVAEKDDSLIGMIEKMKKAFYQKHLFIYSNADEDIMLLKNKYFCLKERRIT